ncbi:MAG: acetyl-CoA decarbonylase/synthase complex subunit gamma, partial [Nitrososphaerales archaeon]
ALRKPEVADSRPLLYAATKDNWREMVVLARKYNCPIVAFEPGGLDELKSLALTIKANGVEDIVLDPGTYTDGAGLRDTLNKFVMIRRAAIKAGDEGLGYPILGVPAITWLDGGEDPVKSYEEAYLAAVMMARSADILILHTLQPYALLALTTLRQNLYSDPRKPVAVEPGLRTFGRPSEDSPVLVTTNFALTYYTVANDIESQGNNCYLLVANTGGLAVECSVAGGQFNASVVKNLIDETKIETKVKHRILIIPQLAARLKGDIEDTTQWEVIVGPRDSSQIRDFLNKNWPPQKN